MIDQHQVWLHLQVTKEEGGFYCDNTILKQGSKGSSKINKKANLRHF